MTIEAVLHYQPIGHRWAINLGRYKAAEQRRFTKFYRSMASSSSVVLARAHTTWQPLEAPAKLD